VGDVGQTEVSGKWGGGGKGIKKGRHEFILSRVAPSLGRGERVLKQTYLRAQRRRLCGWETKGKKRGGGGEKRCDSQKEAEREQGRTRTSTEREGRGKDNQKKEYIVPDIPLEVLW